MSVTGPDQYRASGSRGGEPSTADLEAIRRANYERAVLRRELDREQLERANTGGSQTSSHDWRGYWRPLIIRDLILAGAVGLAVTMSQFILEQRREETRFSQAEQLEEARAARAERLENLRFVRTAILEPDHSKWPSFQGLDLREQHFQGLNLSGSYFVQADLSVAKLAFANLSSANLQQASLIGSDLTGATLRGSHLSSASLQGADLWSINLSGAHATEVNLSDTELFLADLSDADFRKANLEGTVISLTNASGMQISEAQVGGSVWLRVNISGVDFSGLALATADELPISAVRGVLDETEDQEALDTYEWIALLSEMAQRASVALIADVWWEDHDPPIWPKEFSPPENSSAVPLPPAGPPFGQQPSTERLVRNSSAD